MFNTDPVFPQTPHIEFGKVINSYNEYVGDKDLLTKIYTTANNGSFISKIRLMPLGTNVSTVVRIFILDKNNNFSLIHEELVPALTISATVASQHIDINIDTPFEADISFWAATSVSLSSGINVICMGEDY